MAQKTGKTKTAAKTPARQPAVTIKSFIIPTALYSRDELAQVTGLSVRTIERADQEGRLAAVPEAERNKKYLGDNVLTWLGYANQVPMQIVVTFAAPAAT